MSTARVETIAFQGSDLVIGAGMVLALGVLLGPARGLPGAVTSTGVFAFFLASLLLLRTLASAYPLRRGLGWAADFWLLPVVSLSHGLLDPVVDALSPALRDPALAALDLRLFGGHAAVAFGAAVSPGLMDVLLVCYYGHFIWPLTLGVLLYVRGRRATFDEYLLAMALFFTLNFVGYVLVPAVGPRFFLIGAFTGPLEGGLVTSFLDSLMRMPAFVRDCFPSGHTGATLVVWCYAWRSARRLFWITLLPGLGLIAATLAGRFHYAFDLLCAVPLALGCVGLSAALSSRALNAPSVARS